MIVVLLALLGCSQSPIPEAVIQGIGSELSAVGHPKATFVSSETVDWSTGPFENRTRLRYVDVKVKYRREKEPKDDEMLVRIHLKKLQPCKISVDVIGDTGPAPILLDNALSSGIVGMRLCEAMGR